MPTMPKERRLTQNKQFAAISSQGSSRANSLLVLKVLPNGLEYSRYGFSVSRRLGNAVVRNRVRRLMRESARLTEAKPGWDMLFIARKLITDADYHQVKRSVEDLLQRARLKAELVSQFKVAS
jgi:ribonuclease P protein component